jgi:hypothetical protein
VLFEPRADHRGQATHVLTPIDWDKCFAGGSLIPTELRNERMLSMSRPWTDRLTTPGDPMCGLIRTASDFDSAIRKLGGWRGARARLQLMLNGLPVTWQVSDAQKTALLDYFLARVESTIGRLRRPDDPDRAFPNWQHSLDSSA